MTPQAITARDMWTIGHCRRVERSHRTDDRNKITGHCTPDREEYRTPLERRVDEIMAGSRART